MQREPVASSALLSVGYDSENSELEIEFHGGRIYRYQAVPEGVYQFLLRAKSKGGYVNRMIDGHFAFEEVTPVPEQPDLLAALRASLE